APAAETARLMDTLQNYNFIILGLQNLSQRPYRNFGLTETVISAAQQIIDNHPTVTVFFGNPFALAKIPGIGRSAALLLTYQETGIMQDLAAQMVFGAYPVKGRLPVTVSEEFAMGDGLDMAAVNRLRYDIPEAEGMDSRLLERKIDSIAEAGIAAKAYPGCQVLVARHGTVVFHKTYGYHTYAKRQPTQREDLYDFASVTKVTGPLPALMRLHDQGKFQLDVPFYTYWPQWKHSNKKEVIVRDVLAHQARLKSWIPYWRNTVRHGHFKWHTFSLDSSGRYTLYVAPRIFLNKNYTRKIYKAIKKSPLEPEKKYLYSGLSFYLYPQIIKNLTGYDYPDYVKDSIYKPLGAYTITFNPYKNFKLPEIVPTENDTFFRKEQLHGWVHDEGAAMMGGISGNAGLFGTANDLAKLMQMYLQMGEFGGRRFISDSTMHEFTRCQFPENGNRRGLGFDKPLIENATLTSERVYPARSASPSSFGHSGYTGTFTWADPENGLLYIFFSNRVYPTRYNSRIYDLNIRTAIHQVLYDAIKE
ncbi:MAG: serine hydrolase, partial [Chlorobi bacterium]|nr:serine hydrolase [Chlorobiota bacterium]